MTELTPTELDCGRILAEPSLPICRPERRAAYEAYANRTDIQQLFSGAGIIAVDGGVERPCVSGVV